MIKVGLFEPALLIKKVIFSQYNNSDSSKLMLSTRFDFLLFIVYIKLWNFAGKLNFY